MLGPRGFGRVLDAITAAPSAARQAVVDLLADPGLPRNRHRTMIETVHQAIRMLRQDEIAQQPTDRLDDDEATWLDADLR